MIFPSHKSFHSPCLFKDFKMLKSLNVNLQKNKYYIKYIYKLIKHSYQEGYFRKIKNKTSISVYIFNLLSDRIKFFSILLASHIVQQ